MPELLFLSTAAGANIAAGTIMAAGALHIAAASLHIAAGAAVGFAIGLTGVGGGSLMTPLLLMFGYPPPVAIGTDLLYAAITKVGGGMSHHRRGNVNWRVVALLGAGSIPISVLLHVTLLDSLLSPAGLQQAGLQQVGLQQIETQQEAQPGMSAGLLTTSLGIMLMVTALILLFRDRLRQSAIAERPRVIMPFIHRHRQMVTFAAGVLLGVCVTLSSVGAGAFCAAVLLVIYSQTATVRIIGTDIAHAVPLTLVAGAGYLLAGYVDLMLLGGLLIGSLPAIHLGSRLSSRVPDKLLQRVLVLLLFCLGIYYSFIV